MTKWTLTAAIILNFIVMMVAEANQLDSAKRRKFYYPAFIPVQFAGNIGFVSTGVGWIPGQGRYQLSLVYGYVPASVNGPTDIHALTARSLFDIHRFKGESRLLWTGYAGAGISVEVGGVSFLKLPSNYPRGSYFPKAIHIIPAAGLRSEYRFGDSSRWIKGIAPYVEASTVDAYLWYKARSDSIPISMILSIALGINFLLN